MSRILPGTLPALCAAALLLAAGGAAAGAVTFAFAAPDEVQVSVAHPMEDRLADHQRHTMDSDGDGNVTAEEVEAYRERIIGLTDGGGVLDPPTGRTLMDGTPPDGFAVLDYVIEGAQGPVSGGGPFQTTWLLEYRFPVEANLSHVLRLDTANFSVAGHIRAPVTEVVVEAPPGYRVAEAAGLPFGSATLERRVVVPGGPSEWPGTDVYVRFEAAEDGVAEAPLAAWVPAAALAAALAASIRRGAGGRQPVG